MVVIPDNYRTVVVNSRLTPLNMPRAGDMPDFGDFLVTFYCIFSEFGRGRIFAHNTVSDFISSQEVSVRFS